MPSISRLFQLRVLSNYGWFFLLFMGFQKSAYASDLCDYYRKVLPSLAKAFCNGAQRTKPSGTQSSFADAFKLNPAKMPHQPTPYGLEMVYSYIRTYPPEQYPLFSIIKGFQKFGTGVSTAGNPSFFGNDVVQRVFGPAELTDFQERETPKSKLPNLNLGTSFSLGSTEGRTNKLGLSLRYNHVTSKLGYGLGMTSAYTWWTAGIGAAVEDVSNRLASVIFLNGSFAIRLPIGELEYIYMDHLSDFTLPAIHLLAYTIQLGRLTFTSAIRRVYYFQSGTVNQMHFAVQLAFSDHFSAGYLYNYFPGANSLGLQIFL